MNDVKNSIITKSIKGLTHISNREKPYIAIKNKHVIGIKIQEAIEKIPKSIVFLNKLRFLHIYSNNLKIIPQSIGSLPHLRELKIKSTCLSTLPKEVFEISKKYTYGKYIWEEKKYLIGRLNKKEITDYCNKNKKFIKRLAKLQQKKWKI